MKFVKVEVGLNESAKMRRHIVLVLSFAALLGGLALFVFGISRGFPPSMIHMGTGAILAVIALTLFANTHSVVDIVGMNDEYVWLRGAKSTFLNSLPELAKK